ncbi:bcl-2-modifying factor isoform X5 [Ictidomys tridecemlineatus]
MQNSHLGALLQVETLGSIWNSKELGAEEMEPPQCVEELEDDVFQPEDGEPGTQPGSLLSADLFAQSQLDCPLSRLQLFPLTHCCGPGLRPTSQEDKATQTLSPASPSQGVMLPCGVTEEPQRLFYVSLQACPLESSPLKVSGNIEQRYRSPENFSALQTSSTGFICSKKPRLREVK